MGGPRRSRLAGWPSLPDVSHCYTPLQASEVIDFIAGEREPVIRRHCGESGDPSCGNQLAGEIATLGGTFEAMARSSLGMLLDMIDQLAKVPGRKVSGEAAYAQIARETRRSTVSSRSG